MNTLTLYNIIALLIDCPQKIVEITIEGHSTESYRGQLCCTFLISLNFRNLSDLALNGDPELRKLFQCPQKFARFSINLFWRALMTNFSDQRLVALILTVLSLVAKLFHYKQPHSYLAFSIQMIRLIIVGLSIVNSKTIVLT
jgi:hypothetical protein